MPSDERLTLDTLSDGQALDVGEITDGNAPEETDTAPAKLILGKYKSVEELEKGISEERKMFGKQAEELGQLRAETENLRQRAEMKDLIATIAAQANRPKDEPQIDMDKYLAEIGDSVMSDPTAAVKKLAGLNSHWVGQSEKKTLSEVEVLRKELAAVKQQQSDMADRMSPEYQQHKEAIETMVAEGVPLSTARSIVKKLAGNSSSTETTITRNSPPASITPTRASVPDTKAQSVYLYDVKTDLPILAREFPELNQAQLIDMMKQLNEQRANRVSEGQPTVQKSFKQMTRRSY